MLSYIILPLLEIQTDKNNLRENLKMKDLEILNLAPEAVKTLHDGLKRSGLSDGGRSVHIRGIYLDHDFAGKSRRLLAVVSITIPIAVDQSPEPASSESVSHEPGLCVAPVGNPSRAA